MPKPARQNGRVRYSPPDPKTQKPEPSDTPKRESKTADAMPADTSKATKDG